MVVLAQLVRAPDCGSGGRRFEPGILPGKIKASLNSEAFFVQLREVHPEEALSESKGARYSTRLVEKPCKYKAFSILPLRTTISRVQLIFLNKASSLSSRSLIS
jgi:hypothetical protein